MILVNMAQCKWCGDIIKSRHVHDYVQCRCGNLSVDGGHDYLRRNFREETAVRELSLTTSSPFDHIRWNLDRYNSKTEKFVLLKDIEDDWLEAILAWYIPPDNIANMSPDFLLQYLREKQYRLELKEKEGE